MIDADCGETPTRSVESHLLNRRDFNSTTRSQIGRYRRASREPVTDGLRAGGACQQRPGTRQKITGWHHGPGELQATPLQTPDKPAIRPLEMRYFAVGMTNSAAGPCRPGHRLVIVFNLV